MWHFWRRAIFVSLLVGFASAKVRDFVKQSDEADGPPPPPQAYLVERPAGHDARPEGGAAAANYTPVVFWHGMGDTAFGSINVDRLALQKRFPGMRVFSIQIGRTFLEDELASYFVNANTQVEQACQAILNNSAIRAHGSFNAIGFSQGGQFLRALIQRCPLEASQIRVKNFISLGGQHEGVYGLPNCAGETVICDYIRYVLTFGAYKSDVQQHVVQAEYWHDPTREQEYKQKNIFLADINCESATQEAYRRRLANLDNLVLVEFEQDEMVVPRESSHFGFYARGQSKRVVPLNESQTLWKEDRLGLRELDGRGSLKMLRAPGGHLQYPISWLMETIASVYLLN